MRARSLLAMLLLACAAPARADSVPPPPDACPRGSVGRTGHGGTRCEPSTCASDAECGAGRVCRPVALCVREVEATFNTYTQRPARETFRIAVRECGDGASECPADTPAHIGWEQGGRDVSDATSDESYRVIGPARCVTETRCVVPRDPVSPAPRAPETSGTPDAPATPEARPPESPAPATPAASSGCSLRAGGASPALGALVIAIATLVAARRRLRGHRRRLRA